MFQQIFDHFSYCSYKQQRDAGVTAEQCAKWYTNAASLEAQYQMAIKLQQQKN